MADLLNNILSQKTQTSQSSVAPAIKLDFNTANKIKPLTSDGRLLKSHIIGSPVQYVKDLGKDVLSIKKGVQGKANDHELGRMNDLAMKVASLGLAGYLFTKTPFKAKRTMEFVGFGTFFGSMALWPKLAIVAPIKARTGLDIHQKYEDSYGRKKMFFQDPQYTPWALYSKEEMDKLGDKLNVPKDIKNRDEVTKQKAQKIAVQGNTLWMYTAGLASPLMSALACNAIEPKILEAYEKMDLKKSEKALAKLDSAYGEVRSFAESKNSVNKLVQESLEKITSDPFVDVKNEFIRTISDYKEKGCVLKDSQEYGALYGKLGSLNTGDLCSKLSQVPGFEKEKPLSDEGFRNLVKFADENLNAKGYVEGSVMPMLNASSSKEFSPEVADGIKAALKPLGDEDLLKGIDEVYSNSKNKQVLAVDNAVKELAAKYENKAGKKAIEELFEANPKTRLTPEISNQIAKMIVPSSEMPMIEAFTKQLNVEAEKSLAKINPGEFAEKFVKANSAVDHDAVVEYLKPYGDDLSEVVGSSKFVKGLVDVVYEGKGLSTIQKRGMITSMKADVSAVAESCNKPALEDIKTVVMDVVSKFDAFRSQKTVVDKMVDARIGDKSETFIANQWGRTTKKLMKELGLTDAELLAARNSDEETYKIVCKKFSEIAKDDAKYKKVMRSFAEKVAEFDDVLSDEKFINKANGSLDKVVDHNAHIFRSSGYNEILKEVVGGSFETKLAGNTAGTVKKFADVHAKGRVLGARASFYRMIQTLDLFKKLEDDVVKVNKNGVVTEMLKGDMADISPEKLRKILVSYKITDHVEKLNDVGPNAYKKIMNYLFVNDFNSKTVEAIKDIKVGSDSNGLLNGIKRYKSTFVEKIANWENWQKPGHVLGNITCSLNGTERHNLVGDDAVSLIGKTSEKLFTSNKWLKKYTAMFGAVVATTLAAGLLFGKMKKSEINAGDKQ